jgi:hypothetical protein
MDFFDEEIIGFLRSLQKNKVQYLLVGGFATNLNGYQRYTGDIDLWLYESLENRKALRKAFADYGLGDFESIERLEFIPGWTNFHLNNGLELDIMTSMKGLEIYSFEECFSQATIADIDDVQVPVLHINHLIANKKAVNRPKDQLDVIYLEKIKQLRENNS